MILILAWIKRAVTCCAYRIGPERPLNFLSVCDGGNRNHRTHTEWPLATHWLISTVICVHATVVGCDRACACDAVLLSMHVCSTGPQVLSGAWLWAHTVSQLHPTEASPLLGVATESRYETWHHGGRLTKTIRAAPWTAHTSTFPLFFLSSSTQSNYAVTERIYTTTRARIHRIIPCAAPQAVHLSFITSSWITWPVL